MRFANQVVVVTGASSGIGWSLAKELVREGAKVGVLARRRDKLDALAAEIRKTGGTVAVATADVAERAPTIAALHALAAELGPLDLVVANAGLGLPTLLEPLNVVDVENMIRINLLGVVYTMEAVLPEMLRRGRGHLAAVSSLAAYKGLPGESAYCASKAGVNAYREGLRIQLRDRGITVTTICPGFVQTPMTEMNRFHMPWLLDADTAARKIVRALSRRKKVYNFPWQMMVVMRATRWLPDWLVARTMANYNKNPPMPGG
jgi:short-subunit dehydrogenase